MNPRQSTMVGCAAAAFWLIALIPAIVAPDLTLDRLPLFMCLLALAVTASLTWVHGRYGCQSNEAREDAAYLLGHRRGREVGAEPARPAQATRFSPGCLTRPQLIAVGVALVVAAGASMAFASRASSSPRGPRQQPAPVARPPATAFDLLAGKSKPLAKPRTRAVAEDAVAGPVRHRPATRAETRGHATVRVRLDGPLVRRIAPGMPSVTVQPRKVVRSTTGALLQPVGELLR